MTDSEKLQLLLDRAEISEVVYRYATGADRLDADLFASVFTDEMTVHIRGGSFKEGRRQTLPNHRFAQGVMKGLGRFACTQHLFNVYKVEVKGDEAQAMAYMQARHFIRESEGVHPPWDMGGYYVHHLVRTAAGWKVREYSLDITWEQNVAPKPPARQDAGGKD
jgi:hypothetical protein